MSLEGYHELACPKCDGKVFTAAVAILWQNGMGSSPRPNGYICVKCSETVDQAKMIASAKKKDAERKIRELEVQLA